MVEDAVVETVDAQYQYSDGENFVFMNNTTLTL